MDTLPGGVPRTLSQVAGYDRPVCHLPQQQASGVLFSSSGSSTAGVDAMLQPWDHLQAYAFPPFGLIPRLLAKVRQFRGLELTLVAPFWPLKPWFPELLELLVEVPFRLQSRRDLLRQPHFLHFHRNLRALQLTGFRIVSDPRGPSDSLLQWLTNLPGADAPLPGATISLSG